MALWFHMQVSKFWLEKLMLRRWYLYLEAQY